MAAGENLRLGAIVTLASELIDHSKAMTIRIAGHSTATINVPVYDPALYSEAQESLPITGYVSGRKIGKRPPDWVFPAFCCLV